jgi:hypothetical protein
LLNAGALGIDADINYATGVDAFASMMQCPTSLEKAIEEAERLFKDGAESAMRLVIVGRELKNDDKVGSIAVHIAKLPGRHLSTNHF